MATTAMDMVRKTNNCRIASAITSLFLFTLTPLATAEKWQFTPNLGLEGTYTDNIDLVISDKTSSFVSKAIVGFDTDYQSRLASLSISATNNNLFYSHDSELNDSYLTLSSSGQYSLWSSGLKLIASANIANTNRNAANNGLANLVSGDTIQSENYSTGLQYNVNNSSFSIQSSLIYSISRFEDGIGESDRMSATLNTQNANNARIAFWQLSSSLSKSDQNSSVGGPTRTGDQYRVDAKLGLITSFNFTPFIRIYDEDYSGNFGNQNQQTTSSWGPGFRWLVSDHLTLDLSYNYVADDTVSDDYIDTSIEWQPSGRTSLTAGYSQRFFGDSYNFNFQHRSKRLTNSISYDETLSAFDRDNYERVDIGSFWCPSDTAIINVSQCFTQSSEPSGEEDGFQLTNFFTLEPIENTEFSLNKRFVWSSTLQLARTSFSINTAASRRERIESEVIDDTLSSSFAIKRKISGRSDLTLSAKYDYRIFDKDNPEGSRQKDHYRTVSATYTKKLASSLSTNFTVQHVNRDSSIERYSYDEMRAIINITKDF